MPQDECTDPKGPKDQGVFLPQKDEYLRGKFLQINAASLLKNEKLVKGAFPVRGRIQLWHTRNNQSTPNPLLTHLHDPHTTTLPQTPGVDYVQIAKGARNPFRSTVDPKNGDVYFGDVGSSVWEVRT